MYQVNRLGFVVFIFWMITSLSYAQKNEDVRGGKLLIKHTRDFTVTGDGSAAEWENAGWNAITQRPGETLLKAGWHLTPEQINSKYPLYETQFKILYSDKGIYCLYKCEDSTVTATKQADFANLFDEDVVEAFFRPDITMPVYFEYELSPLNYELPILILNTKGNTTGWKLWRYEGENKTVHAVKVNKKNSLENRFTWTAEFFIPYILITPTHLLPPPKGTKWRCNFYRIDYDRFPKYSSWQLTRGNFHDFERFGIIEFD
ncbi:MAG: carbohydrate-binding family 9-like protein [Ginsengibacter sp.]